MSQIETEIDHPEGIEQITNDTMTKTLGQAIEDSHRIDKSIGEDIIDTTNCGTRNENRDRSRERVNYRQDLSNDRNR